MSPSPAGIALCIPVLNEREALGHLLPAIAGELGSRSYTALFVDDGSTDGTVDLLEAAAASDPRVVLLRRQKRGKGCQRGAATRAGLEWLASRTDHELFVDLDADGSQRPCEILPAAERVESGEADVVIASKYVPGSRVLGRPLTRRVGSRVYSGMLRLLMSPRLRDYSNSYRVYGRRAAQALLAREPSSTTPVYLVEMVAIWLAAGLKLVEVPTLYAERVGGETKVTLANAREGFVGAFRVGLRYRRGAYRPEGPRP